MLYIDLIDDAPITMTARQLKLAIQEAQLQGREQAFNEAADMLQGRDPNTAWIYQQFRDTAYNLGTDREEIARQGLATRGMVTS